MKVLTRPGSIAVLALTIAAGPLLAPGVAAAAPPQVSFSGGCGLLGVGASSQPNVSSVRVSNGSSVNFINRLNTSAHLFVNGSDMANVDHDFQVQVSFHAPAKVSMVPACLLGSGGAGSVSVQVTGSSGGHPTNPATVGQPTRGAPTGAASPSVTPSARLSPSVGPSGSVPVPSASSAPASSASPAVVLNPSGQPSGGQLVAIGAATPAGSGHHGPDRLLAVIAAVCLIGVSIALIRAIVAQRAIRTLPA
jgi:hypothetical protein